VQCGAGVDVWASNDIRFPPELDYTYKILGNKKTEFSEKSSEPFLFFKFISMATVDIDCKVLYKRPL